MVTFHTRFAFFAIEQPLANGYIQNMWPLKMTKTYSPLVITVAFRAVWTHQLSC